MSADFLPALRGAEVAKGQPDSKRKFMMSPWTPDDSPSPVGSNRFRPPSSPESFIKSTHGWSKHDHKQESKHHEELAEKNPHMRDFHLNMSLAHGHMANLNNSGAWDAATGARRAHGHRTYELHRLSEYGEAGKAGGEFLPALRGAEVSKAADHLPDFRKALREAVHQPGKGEAAEFYRKYASGEPMGVQRWMKGNSGLSYGSHTISSPSRFDVGMTAEQHETLMTDPFPFAHHRGDGYRMAAYNRKDRENYGAHAAFRGSFSGGKDPEDHKLALTHHHNMASAYGHGTPDGAWHNEMYRAHLHAGFVAGTSGPFDQPPKKLSRREQVHHKRESGRNIHAANAIYDKHFGQGAA